MLTEGEGKKIEPLPSRPQTRTEERSGRHKEKTAKVGKGVGDCWLLQGRLKQGQREGKEPKAEGTK